MNLLPEIQGDDSTQYCTVDTTGHIYQMGPQYGQAINNVGISELLNIEKLKWIQTLDC